MKKKKKHSGGLKNKYCLSRLVFITQNLHVTNTEVELQNKCVRECSFTVNM